MPFDYTIKGWPSPLTLDGKVYTVSSCDREDSGLCYSQAGVKNPHLTIHAIDKEGPTRWRQNSDASFHVRMSNTKLFEYDQKGASKDFEVATSRRGPTVMATGVGTVDQVAEAKRIALAFAAALKL